MTRRNTMLQNFFYPHITQEEECVNSCTSCMKPRRLPLFHSVQLVRVDIAFEAQVAVCDPLLAPPQA